MPIPQFWILQNPEKRKTHKKEDKCLGYLFFFLCSQPIVITISDRKLQFTTYWVLCSLCNFLQSRLFFPFHPVRARAGVCQELSTVLKLELYQTKLNTFHSVLLLLFPPLNSWGDCFYFVTKSSGMTCNTPNLVFNPQCSKEIKLSCSKGQFTLSLTLEVFKLGEQMSQIDQECRLFW